MSMVGEGYEFVISLLLDENLSENYSTIGVYTNLLIDA